MTDGQTNRCRMLRELRASLRSFVFLVIRGLVRGNAIMARRSPSERSRISDSVEASRIQEFTKKSTLPWSDLLSPEDLDTEDLLGEEPNYYDYFAQREKIRGVRPIVLYHLLIGTQGKVRVELASVNGDEDDDSDSSDSERTPRRYVTRGGLTIETPPVRHRSHASELSDTEQPQSSKQRHHLTAAARGGARHSRYVRGALSVTPPAVTGQQYAAAAFAHA